MPLRVDHLPPGPTALWEAVRGLQRDIRELRAARRLEYATISGLQVGWVPARPADWPASTAAAWEDVHRATLSRTPPGAYVVVAHITDDPSTTGQLQLVVGGDPQGAPTTVTSVLTTTTLGPFALPATGGLTELRVRVRRTAGTGTVACQILTAYGT